MRVLAVDPGEKRIGLAISDELEISANPLEIIPHTSRAEDARRIVALAAAQHAGKIVLGITYDQEGNLSPNGRKAKRLGEEIQRQCDLPVALVDEHGTTISAGRLAIEMGVARKKRREQGHRDDIAAVLILQSYLNSGHGTGHESEK